MDTTAHFQVKFACLYLCQILKFDLFWPILLALSFAQPIQSAVFSLWLDSAEARKLVSKELHEKGHGYDRPVSTEWRFQRQSFVKASANARRESN